MMKMVQVEYLSKVDRDFVDNQNGSPKFFAPADMEIEVGDIVLVENYDTAITIAQVKSFQEIDYVSTTYNKTLKVLDVLTDSCSTFQSMYNDVARKRIKKQMEARARELDKLLQYENYAKYDDEFKQLLDEFKAKGGFTEGETK